MNSRELSDLLAEYTYEEPNPVDKPLKAVQNRDSSIEIYDFLQPMRETKRGTCLYLSASLKRRLDNEMPRRAFLAKGHDPHFFTSGRHYFILLFDDSIPCQEENAVYCSQDYFHKKDPLIIDPSFRFAERFREAGYDVEKIYPYRQKFGFGTTAKYEGPNSLPICMLDDTLMLLSATKEEDWLYLTVGLKQKGDKTITKANTMYSAEIDKTIKGYPQAESAISNLRKTEKEMQKRL